MASAAAAAAAAAALYNSVPQNHFLYSQWLATRNTSALFGLQGECSAIIDTPLLIRSVPFARMMIHLASWITVQRFEPEHLNLLAKKKGASVAFDE